MLENLEISKKKKIQVFLATYNRSHLVENAIVSILNQSFDSFELIVSDNSTNDQTSAIINKKYREQVKYIHRIPSTPNHFNIILQEVTSEYFMIFHDDDIMHDNMIECLYNVITEKKEIIAVGSNARVIENGKLKRKNFHHRLKTDITLCNREQIIEAYSIPGFVPFPSYLFRREVAQKQFFNIHHGGKHCDAAFIIDLLTLGSIVFVAKPLMDYYIHVNQDSKQYAFSDELKLINYIVHISKYKKNHPLIRRFRIQNIYGELKFRIYGNKISIFSKSYFRFFGLLCKYSFTEYLPKIILLTLYVKLRINQLF